MRRGRSRSDARRGPRIATSATNEPSAAAVIAAGGRGERAGSTDQLKQFRPLGGRPLLEWSLDVLTQAGCHPIVLVVPDRSMDEARALFESRPGIVFTVGGETRQDSVASGLDEISTEAVVVHDGARPFVPPELVAKVLNALSEYDGAIAAMPADETLKRVEEDRIVETIDRSHVWRAQTPQAFRTDVLRTAHEKARAEGYIGTDDASLLERYGGRVQVVQGTRSNIKLTYPEDFALAEAILRGGLPR